MANTVMTAKNSFSEGLIMDFAPDNTQATCMTSALNATLLTFNGNEMLLQNDMGNGRVETARLPEGYIPVGTCEFGDIIYIVSYNPLNNKALIGCFPSPERNISSDELYEAGENGQLNLTYKDFQMTYLDKEGSECLNGELKNTSVKKVLIDTKKLNPGDKYIIYTNSISITNNEDCLSDIFKSIDIPKHGNNPKYVKLHVVSIEDSGKITYLDTTTKWYDIENLKYYINVEKRDATGKIDIDTYRNMIESNWSIFTSKVSGKLAILAELEMMDSFSCSYDIELDTSYNSIKDDDGDTEYGISVENNVKYKHYKLYLVPSWDPETERGEPSHIMVTKAYFNNNDGKKINSNCVYWTNTNKDKTKNTSSIEATALTASDDEGWTIDKIDNKKLYIADIKIPYRQREDESFPWSEVIRSNSFIYNIRVVPAKPYGRLDLFAIDLSIDFNKIGTGEVKLTTWKYHNSGNTSILTFGIEAYPRPNWEVEKIVIQFYDNLGLAGEYKLDDKPAYSGIFSETIGLDGERANTRLGRYNSIDDKIIHHVGPEVEKIVNMVDEDSYVTIDGDPITDPKHEGKAYINDAGTIYAGVVYGTKIIIVQKHKDSEERFNKTLYRWYWTNAMFNEYYYGLAKDYNDLNFELILDGEAIFESNNNYLWKLKEVSNLNAEFNENEGEHWKTYSANIQYMGLGAQKLSEGNYVYRDNNINMYMNAGLLNDYGFFLLHPKELHKIDLLIDLGVSEIRYNLPEELYDFSLRDSNISDPHYLALIPQVNKDATKIIDIDRIIIGGNEIFTEDGKVGMDNDKFADLFNIYFVNGLGEPVPITLDDNSAATVCRYNTDLSLCYYVSNDNNKNILLSMLALLFNKAYVADKNGGIILVPVYSPIISSESDMAALGITYSIGTTTSEKVTPVTLVFNSAVALNHDGRDGTFSAVNLAFNNTTLKFKATEDDLEHKITGMTGKLINPSTDVDFISDVWGAFGAYISPFFLVYLGGLGSNKNGPESYQIIAGSATNPLNIQNWQKNKGMGLAGYTDTQADRASLITGGSFDIGKDGTITNTNQTNTVALLGTKFKNGMTILNSAFSDNYNEGFSLIDARSHMEEKAEGEGTYLPRFDNFAYLLFLLLVNTYTGNKRANDKQMAIRNYVRNGDYSIELIKNVTTLLKPNKDLSDFNIVMRGIDYLEYLNKVYDNFSEINNEKYSKNVTLKFLSSAKNNELKILVYSNPLSFFNLEVQSYYILDGILVPLSYTLSANSFYIMQNGELIEASNTPLVFDKTTVSNTLKSLFPDSEGTMELVGAHPEKVKYLKPEDKAYNGYLKYLKNYVKGLEKKRTPCSSEREAIDMKNSFINTMYVSFPESIAGISKNEVIPRLEGLPYFSGPSGVFDVLWSEVSKDWGFVILEKALDDVTYIEGTILIASYYTFEPYNFLKHMKYSNGLLLDETSAFSQDFGINGDLLDSAYTGFIRGVVIDKKYLIL